MPAPAWGMGRDLQAVQALARVLQSFLSGLQLPQLLAYAVDMLARGPARLVGLALGDGGAQTRMLTVQLAFG